MCFDLTSSRYWEEWWDVREKDCKDERAVFKRRRRVDRAAVTVGSVSAGKVKRQTANESQKMFAPSV